MKKTRYLLLLFIVFSCVDKNKKALRNTQQEVAVRNASILLEEYLEQQNILVIAHRADWRSACENSILAIENAIEMGVDMIEIDLKKTSDNELILMHDHTLDRTTTGTGYVKGLYFGRNQGIVPKRWCRA